MLERGHLLMMLDPNVRGNTGTNGCVVTCLIGLVGWMTDRAVGGGAAMANIGNISERGEELGDHAIGRPDDVTGRRRHPWRNLTGLQEENT